jgi:hypothetical protein
MAPAPPSSGPPRLLPILYFGAAHLALVLAFAMALLQHGTIAGFYYQPRVVALVHLVTLGWIGLSILGALYIIGPLALRTPMPAGAADHLLFVLALTGVIGMVGHFHIEAYSGMVWSAGLLLPAIGGVGLKTARGIARAPIETAVKAHFILAFVNVLLAGGVGLLIGLHRVTPFLPGRPLAWVHGHLHLAAIGWAALLVVGAGYRLLPMLLPAAMPHGRGLWWSALLLETGALAFLPALLAGGLWPLLAALPAAAGLGAFLRQVVWMKDHPRRPPPDAPRPDYGVLHVVQALIYGVAATGLGATLLLLPEGPATPGLAAAYGVAGLVGGLAQMVLGVGGRIVPMFAAYHLNRNACGVRAPYRAHDLPDRRVQGAIFYIWTAGVPALAVGMGTGTPWLAAAGAALLLAAALLATAGFVYIVAHRVW